MTEAEESNQQFLYAFSAFAAGTGKGEVREFDGVVVMFGRVASFIFNSMGFADRVYDCEDLRYRANAAAEYARTEPYPYFLAICEDLLEPDCLEECDSILAETGLHPILRWVGMVADPLLPPLREAPDLHLHGVADLPSRIAVNEINCIAYDMPCEPSREAFLHDDLWMKLRGTVGYLGEAPVATATAIGVDDRIYVAMVATIPDYRGRGYAEACMRHAIARVSESTGATRIVLHATEMGHSLYLQMGFRDVTVFRLYAPEMVV